MPNIKEQPDFSRDLQIFEDLGRLINEELNEAEFEEDKSSEENKTNEPQEKP